MIRTKTKPSNIQEKNLSKENKPNRGGESKCTLLFNARRKENKNLLIFAKGNRINQKLRGSYL